MAVSGQTMSIGMLVAGEPLEPFRCIKLSAGALVYAEDGEMILGITHKEKNAKPVAIGEAAAVDYLGWTRAECEGVVSEFDPLCAGVDGKVIPALTAYVDTTDTSAEDPVVGSDVIGIALESGVAGDIISILLMRFGAMPALVAVP